MNVFLQLHAYPGSPMKALPFAIATTIPAFITSKIGVSGDFLPK
jgi:hypothetical protein